MAKTISGVFGRKVSEFNTWFFLIAPVLSVDLKLEGWGWEVRGWGGLSPDCHLYKNLLSVLQITQLQNKDDS